MPKPKNAVPSERLRLDGYIPMGADGKAKDPRDQVLLDWYHAQRKNRQAFPAMKELLIAALLGELGPRVQAAVSDGNTEEAREALSDLMDMFVS
jgi:hypothetical protein